MPHQACGVTSIQRDAVTLSWEEPDHDGGMPITGYTVERSDATRGGWATLGSVVPHTTSIRVPKLLEGGRYYFRGMRRECSGGWKQPVETMQPVEVKSPYGKDHSFGRETNVPQELL